MTTRLGGFDGRDAVGRQRLTVGMRFIERDALQARPADHPEVFGPAQGQIVDLSTNSGTASGAA